MSLTRPAATPATYQRVTNDILLRYANETRDEGYFNDVSIIVENECIQANKMVLSCHSLFFEKMFRCEMKEKYEKQVNIQNVDGKAATILIDYMYTGSINIDDENVIKLLAAADYLQMQDVKLFCFQYLESNITTEKWFVILKAVTMYRGDELIDGVYEYVSKNFSEVAQTNDFKTLVNEDLKYLLFNLSRNEISETALYYGFMHWAKYDAKSRKDKLLDLFQHVGIDHPPSEFIEEILHDFIENSIDCYDVFVTRLNQLIKNQGNGRHDSKLVSVGGGDTHSKIIEVYSLYGRIVSEVSDYPDFPVSIWCHYLVKLKNYVFCVGGDDDGEPAQAYTNVWRYDVGSRPMHWRKVAPMIKGRYLMGATEHDGKLVVAGGNDGVNNYLSSAEVCDLTLEKWSQISSMKQPRSANALVSCQGRLYALGGSNDSVKSSSSVECLKDLQCSWEESPPMLKPRTHLAAVSCNDMIYAIGGQCGEEIKTTTKTVEKFDLETNVWVFVSEMNTERNTHAACVMNGKIYAVGGFDSRGMIVHTIECYNPLHDTWSIVGETSENLDLWHHAIVAL